MRRVSRISMQMERTCLRRDGDIDSSSQESGDPTAANAPKASCLFALDEANPWNERALPVTHDQSNQAGCKCPIRTRRSPAEVFARAHRAGRLATLFV